MDFKYFPDKPAVEKAMGNDDPLLLMVAFDESELLVGNIDDALEHHILLKNMGHRETEIDKFFRVVLNRDGADWAFVCPGDYMGIADRSRRIETFHNDGIDTISRAALALGYKVHVNVPARYRRHFNTLGQ